MIIELLCIYVLAAEKRLDWLHIVYHCSPLVTAADRSLARRAKEKLSKNGIMLIENKRV